MGMREKLIELLDNFSVYDDWYTNGEIADHLIANDVVPVVRCKDCKHCDPENRHCDHPMGTEFPFPRKADDFCSYGERRTDV